MIYWRKNVQFRFFRFSRQNLGGHFFDTRFREILIKNSKNWFARTCWILKGRKSWKMSPFEALTKDPRKKNHRGGHFVPPPCKIGLKSTMFQWGRRAQKGSVFFSSQLPQLFSTKNRPNSHHDHHGYFASLVYSISFILSNLFLPNLTRDWTLAYSHPGLGSEIFFFFVVSNLFLPNLTRNRTLAYSHRQLD